MNTTKSKVLILTLACFSFVFCCFLFSLDTFAASSPDAIAIRVMPNPNHYSPLRWYQEKGFSGSPQSLEVDGYEAVRDGRAVYVNAVNVDYSSGYCEEGGQGCDESNPCSNGSICTPKLYTNIYLISYNQAAEDRTIDIFGQILSRWKFNTNLDQDGRTGSVGQCSDPSVDVVFEKKCRIDSDCSDSFCNSLKAKIIRDAKRLADLADFRLAIENYQEENGFYPKLNAGTYVQNISLSSWPSWQDNLGKELGVSLYSDPVNSLGECPGYNSTTCWNENEKQFADPNPENDLFELPENSFNYIYTGSYDGSTYKIQAVMESGLVYCGDFDVCFEGSSRYNYQGISINRAPDIDCGNLNSVAGDYYEKYIRINDPEGDKIKISGNIDGIDLGLWPVEPIYWSDWIDWEWASSTAQRLFLENTSRDNYKKIYSDKAGNDEAFGEQYKFKIIVADDRDNIASTTCSFILMSQCGDGFVNGSEECDGENGLNDWSCLNAATLSCNECFRVCSDGSDPYEGRCGNSRIDGPEICDESDGLSGWDCTEGGELACSDDCSSRVCSQGVLYEGECGDGVKQPEEDCDDDNSQDSDGCNSACEVEPGYNCSGSPSVCVTECGDGIVAGNEQCDDNNLDSLDGCGSSCEIENGYSCSGSPSVCSEICGDELVVGNEECDYGQNINCCSACNWACGEDSLMSYPVSLSQASYSSGDVETITLPTCRISSSDFTAKADINFNEIAIGTAIVFVTDNSGSMGRDELGGVSKMELAKDALKETIDSLHQATFNGAILKVGLVAFAGENEVSTFSENGNTLLDVSNLSEVNNLKDEIDNYPFYAGWTWPQLGLNAALDILNNSNETYKVIVLLGDGEESVNGATNPVATNIKSQGIDIYSVAFTDMNNPINDGLKRDMCEWSSDSSRDLDFCYDNGNYSYGGNEASSMYNSIISSILSTPTGQVVVNIGGEETQVMDGNDVSLSLPDDICTSEVVDSQYTKRNISFYFEGGGEINISDFTFNYCPACSRSYDDYCQNNLSLGAIDAYRYWDAETGDWSACQITACDENNGYFLADNNTCQECEIEGANSVYWSDADQECKAFSCDESNNYFLYQDTCRKCDPSMFTGATSAELRQGQCIALTCENGYHLSNNACVSNTMSCDVVNGTNGIATWLGYDGDGSDIWGNCVNPTCDPAYPNFDINRQMCVNACGLADNDQNITFTYYQEWPALNIYPPNLKVNALNANGDSIKYNDSGTCGKNNLVVTRPASDFVKNNQCVVSLKTAMAGEPVINCSGSSCWSNTKMVDNSCLPKQISGQFYYMQVWDTETYTKVDYTTGPTSWELYNGEAMSGFSVDSN